MKYLIFIPIVFDILDVFENIGIINIIKHYPVRLNNLSELINIITMIKLTFVNLVFVTLIVGFALTIYLKVIKKYVINY